VEVFTPCAREEHDWSNQIPEGTIRDGGLVVHRHRLDHGDRDRYQAAVRAILQSDGLVSSTVEEDYCRLSLRSSPLVEELRRRADEFDAVVVGPYLFGLTLDVARALPDKTLLLPCFHDEPFARLRTFEEHYTHVGGILYHSPEEMALAETRLGINHPRAVCIDALVDTTPGDPEEGRTRAGSSGRYLVYCGRFLAEKNLPLLLDYAHRYLALHPERFTFVFLGQGTVPIPAQPGFRDLGFVAEPARRDILAGAAALVQLSLNESLSHVVLEAWAQGIPVLVDSRCDVLAGQLRRSGGGQAVGSFEEFAQALDDLAEKPETWRDFGLAGQEYVRQRYGSRLDFARKIEEAIRGLHTPLAVCMRQRGLQRAAQFDRAVWRRQFAEIVERLLDAGPRPQREEVEVKPRSASRTVTAGSGTALIPVRVVNRGSHALLAEGPGRTSLRCSVHTEEVRLSDGVAPLPDLLIPGRALATAVAVPVPTAPGRYRVGFWAERVDRHAADEREDPPSAVSWLELIVEENRNTDNQTSNSTNWCAPLVDAVQEALTQATRLQRLPDDYTDVTEGLFATWKRLIKRKLLGNFKHAYVDVLSRQQSAFNQAILDALREVVECCATLGQASIRPSADSSQQTMASTIAELSHQLAETRQHCAALEERLARLEGELKASPIEV
jgi:glycosyltransferase involved in cell wall biosynthesis